MNDKDIRWVLKDHYRLASYLDHYRNSKFNLYFRPLIDQATTKIYITLSSQLARTKFQTASATGFDAGVRSKINKENIRKIYFLRFWSLDLQLIFK